MQQQLSLLIGEAIVAVPVSMGALIFIAITLMFRR